jgi:hypothetical protein
VRRFQGPALEELPRDYNWLLIMQCVLEAALAVGERDVVDRVARALLPYEGRAVFNAGAVMFHGVTDDTLARAAAVLGDAERADRLRASALATYERIGAQRWRDRLARWRPPDLATARGVRRAHLRRAGGDVWMVGADAVVPLRDLRGLRYLRELVRRPGQPIRALDLVAGGAPTLAEPHLGEVADRRALDAYRRRLREIDDELDEAESWSDSGRVSKARAERDALVEEIARSTGLGGRPRTAGGSEERARVAVKKAISAAIERVETVDPVLADHLRV